MPAAPAFRLGYSTLTWGRSPDLERVLAVIAGAGWDGVELFGIPADWLGTPARVRRLLERHGLPPAALFGSVGIGPDAAESLERERRRIEYAAELGAQVYAFIGGDRTPGRLPGDEELRRLAEAGDALTEHAEALGVTVAYHPHPGKTVETGEEIDRLLGFTDRLRLCLDVSSAAVVGDDPVAQLRRYHERLSYVHMKDWARGKYCAMGQGTLGIDFKAALDTLVGLGYAGWVMGEHSLRSDTGAEDTCRANRAYLRGLGY